MSRFEELMNKSLLCLEAAKRTSGTMRKCWESYARELKQQAMNLTLEEAEKIVKRNV